MDPVKRLIATVKNIARNIFVSLIMIGLYIKRNYSAKLRSARKTGDFINFCDAHSMSAKGR